MPTWEDLRTGSHYDYLSCNAASRAAGVHCSDFILMLGFNLGREHVPSAGIL